MRFIYALKVLFQFKPLFCTGKAGHTRATCGILIFGALLYTFITVNGAHASGCYTPEEAAAEQALKLHSELMVIALNCRHVQFGKNQPVFEKYRNFTRRHSDVLKSYEDQMIDYFKKQGVNDPLDKFNALRTDLANDLASVVVQMRPDIFCFRYLKRLDQANAMSGQEFRQWSATHFPGSPPSRAFCSKTSFSAEALRDHG